MLYEVITRIDTVALVAPWFCLEAVGQLEDEHIVILHAGKQVEAFSVEEYR